MAYKMKYKNLKEVVEQLNSAVVMHGKQAKTIEKHIDKMESPMKKYASDAQRKAIYASKAENSPAKAKAKGMDGKACWKGYSLRGTKMKGGKRVDNCVKN